MDIEKQEEFRWKTAAMILASEVELSAKFCIEQAEILISELVRTAPSELRIRDLKKEIEERCLALDELTKANQP